jgi:hypothetical protein
MNAAIVTPFVGHLPFHPSAYLGYGAAVLRNRYMLDIIDINAGLYFKNRRKLRQLFSEIEEKTIITDPIYFHPLYSDTVSDIEAVYESIPWDKYQSVFITTPSWFVTIPTEDILKLSLFVKRESPESQVYFFGNSLGSWTDAYRLTENGIHIVHLNDLFKMNPANEPVDFDTLPTPFYENREKYIFDLLPFRLKHGCTWGKCSFCSLARGWNAGYRERSAKKALQEIEALIDRYHPEMLVCRDNCINGGNLLEFCAGFKDFKTPWAAMGRADLSDKEIEALHSAGCRFVYFGLESGSDRVLARMNKGIDAGQMSNFIRTLSEHDIMPAPSLIVGAPGETEDDFEQTRQFILYHRNYLEVINLYPFIPTPASELTETKKQPHRQTERRLKELIAVCEEYGMLVCLGEQSAEYILFKKVYPGRTNY